MGDSLAERIIHKVYDRRAELFALSPNPERDYVCVLSLDAVVSLTKFAKVSYTASPYGPMTNEKGDVQETMMGFPVKRHPNPTSLQHVILCSKDDWRAIESEWKV